MLATRFKHRLRRGLSYPLGLADLERAIGAISQASELQVSFSRSPLPTSVTAFQSQVDRDLPHLVLEARFVRWDKGPSLSDSTWTREYMRGHWSISVYPVASIRRAQARKVLLAALPLIQEWFSRSRPESWYHGQKSYEIEFDPAEGTLRANDHVEAL